MRGGAVDLRYSNFFAVVGQPAVVQVVAVVCAEHEGQGLEVLVDVRDDLNEPVPVEVFFQERQAFTVRALFRFTPKRPARHYAKVRLEPGYAFLQHFVEVAEDLSQQSQRFERVPNVCERPLALADSGVLCAVAGGVEVWRGGSRVQTLPSSRPSSLGRAGAAVWLADGETLLRYRDTGTGPLELWGAFEAGAVVHAVLPRSETDALAFGVSEVDQVTALDDGGWRTTQRPWRTLLPGMSLIDTPSEAMEANGVLTLHDALFSKRAWTGASDGGLFEPMPQLRALDGRGGAWLYGVLPEEHVIIDPRFEGGFRSRLAAPFINALGEDAGVPFLLARPFLSVDPSVVLRRDGESWRLEWYGGPPDVHFLRAQEAYRWHVDSSGLWVIQRR